MVALTIAALFRAIISLIVSAVVIWAAQIFVLPKEKEKPFISVLGLAIVWAIVDFIFNKVLLALFRFPLSRLILGIVVLILWLLLLKSWFNVGWGHAILISVVAWILNIIVLIVLGIARML